MLQLIRSVIRVAKKHKKYIGICGQAPSEYPEFLDMLVKEGIENIAINPDTLIEARQRVAAAEQSLGSFRSGANAPMLGIVSGIALLCAGFLAIGMGCTPIQSFPESTVQETTPSELRLRAEEKYAIELERAKEDLWVSTEVPSLFAGTIEYPAGWTLVSWNGGITIHNPKTRSYLSIYPTTAPPLPNADSFTLQNIDGTMAELSSTTPDSGYVFRIVRVPVYTSAAELEIVLHIPEKDGTIDRDHLFRMLSLLALSPIPSPAHVPTSLDTASVCQFVPRLEASGEMSPESCVQ